jgi:hypothetical protein
MWIKAENGTLVNCDNVTHFELDETQYDPHPTAFLIGGKTITLAILRENFGKALMRGIQAALPTGNALSNPPVFPVKDLMDLGIGLIIEENKVLSADDEEPEGDEDDDN